MFSSFLAAGEAIACHVVSGIKKESSQKRRRRRKKKKQKIND